MRKTKIIATIGPSSENPEVFRKLVQSGANVIRMNFSHGDHEEHGRRIKMIQQFRQETGLPLAILLDTKGPEIRIGTFENGKVLLEEGQKFTLTVRDLVGDREKVSISYKGLPYDVSVGDCILLDDGLVELRVEKIADGQDIECTVVNGGLIGNRKGVNVPGVQINLPAITQKDIDDIRFGIENGIDFIAASFVRKPADVLEIRKILEEYGGSHIQIISKIENQEGVNNIEGILDVSDGIMIARGDLGVEIPTEDVPIVQKTIIRKCNIAGKPVITATQMLDSMMRNPRPTRAEANDVANAIFDGTDAIMLSGETASGRYPLEAVQTMAKIAERVEGSIRTHESMEWKCQSAASTVTDAISHATCTIAMDLGASAIITATSSGGTARMVSKHRPGCPIIAVTMNKKIYHALSLLWGVTPFLAPRMESTDEMIEKSVGIARRSGMVKDGDLVVITAGVPVAVSGTTNLVKVHTVGADRV